MTIEELRLQEIERKKREEEHKIWLKEKDWFVLVDTEKLYHDKCLKGQKMWVRLSELGDMLNHHDITQSPLEKCVYKTNKWVESLKEFDY